ncbi:MAG: hypothetical protein AAGK97_14010, partial [Bacteroidota bacterium]
LNVFDTAYTVMDTSICEGETLAVGSAILFIPGQYIFNLETINGCDSTVVVNLDVNPSYEDSISVEICEGESYNGYDQTGNYSDTLSTSNGCDSIIHLSLNVIETVILDWEIELCDGDTIEINGIVYDSAGAYSYTIESGCDTIVNFEIFILPSYEFDVATSICDGDSIIVGDTVYFESGNYTDTLETILGCDSIINLDLVVLEEFLIDTITTICEGDSIVIDDDAFTETGMYEVVLQSSNGCDSIINLDLTVIPNRDLMLMDTICAGDSIIFNGIVIKEAGNYIDTIMGAECDAIITLDVVVLDTFEIFILDTICEGDEVIIGSNVFNATGNYSVVLPTAQNCDSTINLDLVVLESSRVLLFDTICQNNTFPNPGNEIFVDTLTGANGCDSIITLNLTIHPVYDINLMNRICAGDSIVIGDSVYTETGIYTNTFLSSSGCDSIITLDLVVVGFVDS